MDRIKIDMLDVQIHRLDAWLAYQSLHKKEKFEREKVEWFIDEKKNLYVDIEIIASRRKETKKFIWTNDNWLLFITEEEKNAKVS